MIEYDDYEHRGKGYHGYSMSNNAVSAYSDGEMPLSKWTKRELVDAIDSKDDEKIIEETGDVLMQGVFHSVLGEERCAFTVSDVLSGVCRKLIFRHSHIFGKDKATDADSALSVWERNKKAEKSA